MKLNIFKKLSLFISGFILCFLFVVPLSKAEQLNNDLTKQVFSIEDLKALKAPLQEKGVASVDQAVADDRQIKIPLNERLNATISFEKLPMIDLADKNIEKKYNAFFGFQIILR